MNMQSLNITIFGIIAVSLEVGSVNFFHAIWVRFHPDFNVQALRKFFGQGGHTSPNPKLPWNVCGSCNIKRKKKIVYFSFVGGFLFSPDFTYFYYPFLPIWFCFGSSHSGLPIASSNLGHFLDKISELILQMKEGAIMCKTQPPMCTWWKLIEDMTEQQGAMPKSALPMQDLKLRDQRSNAKEGWGKNDFPPVLLLSWDFLRTRIFRWRHAKTHFQTWSCTWLSIAYCISAEWKST